MSHAGREVRGPRARNPGGGVLSDDGQHNNLFLTGRGEGSKKNKIKMDDELVERVRVEKLITFNLLAYLWQARIPLSRETIPESEANSTPTPDNCSEHGPQVALGLW